jgi:hypothetical protein
VLIYSNAIAGSFSSTPSQQILSPGSSTTPFIAPSGSTDWFGTTCSLNSTGTILAVGAIGFNVNSGRVLIFNSIIVTRQIAIGNQAGQAGQGVNAIAIGYQAGQTNQHSNSIVLNASGLSLNSGNPNAFYVKPIRVTPDTTYTAGSTTMRELIYDISANEIVYSNLQMTAAKAFIIDHPDDPDRYLVHTCLEGPEVGVYYRGKGEITNNESVVVQLPPYVANLAYDFTVQITHISSGKVNTYGASEVEKNQFTVYGPNGRFFWMVNATRGETVVEPLKTDVDVRGNGPYRWIHF